MKNKDGIATVLFLFTFVVIASAIVDTWVSERPFVVEKLKCVEDIYSCPTIIDGKHHGLNCGEIDKIFKQCETDVHRLDADGDGIPCEELCGGYL